jgi:hypothetical protein
MVFAASEVEVGGLGFLNVAQVAPGSLFEYAVTVQ